MFSLSGILQKITIKKMQFLTRGSVTKLLSAIFYGVKQAPKGPGVSMSHSHESSSPNNKLYIANDINKGVSNT